MATRAPRSPDRVNGLLANRDRSRPPSPPRPHVIDRNKGDPVGAVEHEGHLAIMHTGLQVDYLACAELQQLLNGHLAQRAELR